VKIVYKGKTKDIYRSDYGNYVLIFKDDVTGQNGVFDPGANTVGFTMMGAGEAGLKLTKYYFELLHEKGIPTHYLEADIENRWMKVKPAQVFGNGLEVICRYRAVGSFLRRYNMYAREGQLLDAFVEVTLKDDANNDPPINEDALDMLGIITRSQYQILKTLTQKIAAIIKKDLARKEIELYDIKLEFGKAVDSGEIILIDEISGGNMRAYKAERLVGPLELAELVLN
jgi:phosphoribosylaminoimidazole-succinocarboxamide synthase